ncbi:MAG: hypothetical protein JWO76_289 [Nocardioides sp.]|nr:hypothetical protein [Nocardioides sp.]
MHSSPSSRRPARHTALLLAALALALSGCSSSDNDSDGSPAATNTPGTSSTPDPSPTEDAQPSALEAEAEGGGTLCSARTARHQKVSLYDPIASAHGDLTITDVSATGSDVAILDAEGVVVTARPAFGPGVFIGGAWPIPDKPLAGKTDLSTRTDLVGMKVADGGRVLPLVRVEVNPHSELIGIRLTYTWGDGTDTAKVVLPVHTRFAARTC